MGRIRIRSTSIKLGAVVLWSIAILLIALLAGTTLAVVGALVVEVAGLIVFTRTFRGRFESAARRPWWKLTAGAGSGLVVGLLFLAQAACGLGTRMTLGPGAVVYAVAQLIIAFAFLASGGTLLRAASGPASHSGDGARRAS